MKLIFASVNGLFGDYDHSVSINSDGITFIHSANGVGKTVFLTLIHNLLRCDRDAINSIRFSKALLRFDDGSEIVAEQMDSGLSLKIVRNRVYEDIISAESVGITSPTYVTSSRLVIRKADGSLMYSLDVFTEELKDWFLSAKDDSAISIEDVECPEDISDAEMVRRLMDLKAKTDFMYNSGFRVNLPVGLKFPPSRYDIGKNHDGYLKLVYALEEYVERNHQLAESITVYQDVINSFFTNKRLVINGGRMGIVLGNGSMLSMECLSSGEKHLLILFYCLLFQARPGSLVIMDEPEISLHISWQQRLGSLFTDICRLRGIQMLIATHSPQTIHDLWDFTSELR